MLRATFTTALLALTFLAAPASADHLGLGPGPFQLGVPSVDARQGSDGYPDASVEGLALGQCMCNCPIVGGGVGVAAAGQRVSFFAASALVVCGVLYDIGVDSGAFNHSADPSITPRVVVYLGGSDISDPRDMITVTMPGVRPLP